MSVMDAIIERLRAARPRIVLSEGDDPRIQEAAAKATKDGLAQVTLIGAGVTAPSGVDVIDPAT